MVYKEWILDGLGILMFNIRIVKMMVIILLVNVFNFDFVMMFFF